MRAWLFSALLWVGLALLTAGTAWKYSIADGLMVCGLGVIVLTFITLQVAGRR